MTGWKIVSILLNRRKPFTLITILFTLFPQGTRLLCDALYVCIFSCRILGFGMREKGRWDVFHMRDLKASCASEEISLVQTTPANRQQSLYQGKVPADHSN